MAPSAQRTQPPSRLGDSRLLVVLAVACLGTLASLVLKQPILALAATPQHLTNFQNEYHCDNQTVRIVRPRNVGDVQDAVKAHAIVQASGEGHSWNQPFFCAPPANGTSEAAGTGGPANIVLTTFRPLNISVDEQALAVDVDAGVKTIDLLVFLGNYVTKMSPTGYTLPAFPWFVYQSIGGAVATGSHGSSLTWGSLSHQLLSVTMVLANGTLRTFTPESDPFLMRAVRVSVGQLGVITRIRLRLAKEQPVKRTLRTLPASGFLSLLDEGQQQYRQTGTVPDWANETEFFWITQRSEFMMVSYVRGDVTNGSTRHDVLSSYKSPEDTTVYNTVPDITQDKSITQLDQLPLLPGVEFGAYGLAQKSAAFIQNITSSVINAPLPKLMDSTCDEAPATSSAMAMAACTPNIAAGSKWNIPDPKPVSAFYVPASMAAVYMDISRAGVSSIANNATLEAHLSYLYQPAALIGNIRTVLYDQYEVAIPVDTMADCFRGLLNLVYQGDVDSHNLTQKSADKGFRTAPLIRFVAKEDGLLSYTGDVPRIFLNIEDYLFYNQGRRTNPQFKAVVGYLRSSPACGAGGLNGTGSRLHWGKAGWPDPGCWHGDKEYSETWCDFGCAKLALDPTGKFSDSAPDRWNWDGVDLKACCGPNGFMKDKAGCKCAVKHKRSAADCGPSPYYTNR